jgi:hypothetical protein
VTVLIKKGAPVEIRERDKVFSGRMLERITSDHYDFTLRWVELKEQTLDLAGFTECMVFPVKSIFPLNVEAPDDK